MKRDTWLSYILHNMSRGMESVPIFIIAILILTFINFGPFHYQGIKYELLTLNFFISFSILILENTLLLHKPISKYLIIIEQQKFVLNAKNSRAKYD